jgi:hypothetical protein
MLTGIGYGVNPRCLATGWKSLFAAPCLNDKVWDTWQIEGADMVW